ncbi:MAG: caspase family protein, partial [Planctomycetales bacterium]|nr:caspase family protein [Planctomycetales bacterium]
KGLREGDLLKEISYEEFQAGGALRRTTLSTAEEMQAFLEVPRFDLAVRFIFERNGADVPGFQSYTHWRELAAQVIAVDREWALWTPSGFYDASFNGNRLFGWQINRGLERQPDFYRADRFQAVLERPDLIRRLLPTGSVQQAAQVAGKQKIGFGDVLANSLALQPIVRILAPLDDQAVAGHETEIRAEVLLAQGQQLASAKAYVSGVAAAQPRQLRRESLSNGQQRIELSWQATLPSDKNLQIQVYCSTREKLVAADSRQLARAAALSPRRKPKLYLLAAGISEYRDSRVPDLQLGAANAVGFMETLLPAAAELYDVQPIVLTDTSVTPAVWRSTLRQLESQFRQVQADDLILLFVSGHGLLDTNNDYYFVTANARYSDLVRKNFRDCLSFAELASWSDAPCRKIAILDTCHSGAIQPLDSQQLKQAVRYLQSDLILTLTASEGNQLAAEYRGAQASLFTSALQQSLREPQDGNGNGLLDWPELVRQVSDRVTRQSLAGSVPQFPTAGPKDLLESLELPLAGGDGVTTPRPALVSHRNAP